METLCRLSYRGGEEDSTCPPAWREIESGVKYAASFTGTLTGTGGPVPALSVYSCPVTTPEHEPRGHGTGSVAGGPDGLPPLLTRSIATTSNELGRDQHYRWSRPDSASRGW